MALKLQNPAPQNDWAHNAQVVIDRLTTIVHIYKKPPHPDVFMAESMRQVRAVDALKLLRQTYDLLEAYETSAPGQKPEVATALKDGLIPCFTELLRHLPAFSADMQLLLKSPWFENCSSKLANELFRGPHDNEAEGIGSGNPANGRLPEVLQNLLDNGQPAAGAGANDGRGESIPERHDPVRQMTSRNSTFLRSAGRVD